MAFQSPCALLGCLNVDADDDVMDAEEDEDLAGDLMYSKELRGVVADEVGILGYEMNVVVYA
jgi:hypothetical protein